MARNRLVTHFISSILVGAFFLGMNAQAKDHVLPESEYPYWPEYTFLKTSDLETIEKQPWINKNHIMDGWDWSLPDYVEPSPHGLVGLQRIMGWDRDFEPLNTPFKSNGVGILWVRWRDIEKTEGDFDFSPIIRRIEQANSVGLDVLLRILCHSKSRGGNIDKGQAPLWLEDLGAGLLPQRAERDNLNFDPADPVFQKHYLRLVNELKKTAIPQMVKAAYVGYASHSLGDEGIGPHGERNYMANDKEQHVRERLDAWADAFEGMESKVFMGGPSDYGFDKGFGARKGFVENYYYRIPDHHAGQYIDDHGYLCVDEEAVIIKNQCFNGEVNEEYEKGWATAKSGYRFGKTTNSFPYRYFMSNLRVLQMRSTYVHTTGHLIPEMLPFISQELGRTVEDTPDAWSFLVETHLKDNKGGVCKNWERWLNQRDAPGYETTPAVKIQHAIKMWMIEPGKHYDHIARKGKKMGFRVDDRLFPNGEQETAIKISFHDGVKGTLKLVYQTNNGVKSETIKTRGEDKIRTATFFIHAKINHTGFDHGFSFILESEEEIPVSFVRVIKTEAY